MGVLLIAPKKISSCTGHNLTGEIIILESYSNGRVGISILVEPAPKIIYVEFLVWSNHYEKMSCVGTQKPKFIHMPMKLRYLNYLNPLKVRYNY